MVWLESLVTYLLSRFGLFLEFDGWNVYKIRLSDPDRHVVYFKEREVWWCSIGVNIGYEENGKGVDFCRPVLILRKFSNSAFIGVPLSSVNKSGKFYYSFCLDQGKASVALLSQIRFLDARRLISRVGIIDAVDFYNIRKSVKELL